MTTEKDIAEQLNAMPVPDLQDSIWQSIEQMLDAPLPETPRSTGAPARQYWMYIGGVILAVIVVTVLLLVKKQEAGKKKMRAPDTHELPFKEDTLSANKRADTLVVNATPYPAGKKPVAQPATQQPSTRVARPAGSPGLYIPAVIDSAAIRPPAVTDSANKLKFIADTVSKQRKPGGVQGITDSSYRITPNKKN